MAEIIYSLQFLALFIVTFKVEFTSCVKNCGSGSPNAIGTGVFGRMLSATVLVIFFVPVFFVVVFQFAQRWFPKAASEVDSSK